MYAIPKRLSISTLSPDQFRTRCLTSRSSAKRIHDLLARSSSPELPQPSSRETGARQTSSAAFTSSSTISTIGLRAASRKLVTDGCPARDLWIRSPSQAPTFISKRRAFASRVRLPARPRHGAAAPIAQLPNAGSFYDCWLAPEGVVVSPIFPEECRILTSKWASIKLLAECVLSTNPSHIGFLPTRFGFGEPGIGTVYQC